MKVIIISRFLKKEFQLGALRITQEAGTGSAQAIGIMTNRVNRRLVSYTVSYGDKLARP